jgi:peptide/nickel transport system permease protein
MIPHLLRRLAGSALVLLVVAFIIVMALDVVPGDAAEAIVGDSASEEQLDALRSEMDLDRSPMVRYLDFLWGAVTRGDLGKSLVNGRQVRDLLLHSLSYTLILALSATGLSIFVGGVIGILAAAQTKDWLDTLIMAVTALGLAIPTFWSGLLLILVFAVWLDWLPVLGAGSWQHLVLPTLTLALPTTAVVARLTRSGLLEELSANYVRTARAKGVPPRLVLARHVLRNGLLPVLTVLGLHLGHLLGGTFIVETIFGWPGLGRLTVQAIFDRDLPVVLGAALVMATAYLVINLGVDLIHAWLDPRVAHQSL